MVSPLIGGSKLGWPGRLFIVACVITAIALNQSAVHWRENNSDSHLFAYYGWRVAHGATPYLDVWDNKPPGIWLANAISARFFPINGHDGEILIAAIALLLTLISALAIVRLLAPPAVLLIIAPPLCLGLSALWFEAGANRAETFVVAFEAAAVAAYLRWARDRRARWLLVCGFCAGLAPLFKQSGMAALFAILPHFVWRLCHRRRGPRVAIALRAGSALLVAGLLPIIAMTAWLAARGALSEAVFAVVTFNRAYFLASEAGWGSVPWSTVFEAVAPLRFVYVLAALGMIATILATVRADPTTPAPREKAAPTPEPRPPTCKPQLRLEAIVILGLWHTLAVLIALGGAGRLAYHLAPALPSLLILSALPLAAIWGERGLMERLLARPTSFLAIAATWACFWPLSADQAELLSRDWSQRARLEPEQAQAEIIRANSEPSDGLFVWGWSPGTYRFAERASPTRFATNEKVGQVGAGAQFTIDEAVATLMETPPEIFVVSTTDWANDPRPAFFEWVSAHYQELSESEGMLIFKRAR